MIRASARPVIPRPMRRLPRACSACCCSGKRDRSMTLSSRRTASALRCADGIQIQAGVRTEWFVHEARQVDRTQVAGTVRRQRYLAAGVRGADMFTIAKIILPVDSVNKQHTGFCALIIGAHDLFPQTTRRHLAQDPAGYGPGISGPLPFDQFCSRRGGHHRAAPGPGTPASRGHSLPPPA